MRPRDAGFSLVELLIAMAMMVTFSTVLMSLVLAGQSMARMQPEAADVQQRGRIALQTIGAELAFAGAGLDRGSLAGPLAQYFPPVLPSADDGITLWYISGRVAQTPLVAPFAQGTTDMFVESVDGFSGGRTAIVLDGHGCHDVLRVDAVSAIALTVRAGVRTCAYGTDAVVAQGEVRTYRVDPATRQLLRRDEATGTTVPVMDNVTAMTVEYLDGGRRLRLTLRLAAALSDPRLPALDIAYDVMPANLQEL